MKIIDRSAGRLSLVAICLAAVIGATLQVPAANAAVPSSTAPEAAGAPFIANQLRTQAVLDRAELLRRELTVTEALAQLSPTTPEFTRSALLAEAASLGRRIDGIDVGHLEPETADWGITVGIFPVDELRKPLRNDWGEPRSGGRRHQGNDTLAQIGVPLRAIEDGTVQRLTTSSLGGRTVYLLGESGARYYYAHLDEVEPLIVGDTIFAGEQVGTVGDSGNARGAPHLHLQWSPTGDSNWQNPYPLLVALYDRSEPVPVFAYGPPNARD